MRSTALIISLAFCVGWDTASTQTIPSYQHASNEYWYDDAAYDGDAAGGDDGDGCKGSNAENPKIQANHVPQWYYHRRPPSYEIGSSNTGTEHWYDGAVYDGDAAGGEDGDGSKGASAEFFLKAQGYLYHHTRPPS